MATLVRPIADCGGPISEIVPTAERDEPVDGEFNDDRRRRLIAESSRED